MANTGTNPALISALQQWHRATEAANRENRNLLQYTAGIAALLGISAGSSGVFAVAESLKGAHTSSAPWWVVTVVASVAGVAGVAVMLMLVLAVHAYLARRSAELRADEHLGELIALDPDRFWPKEE